jgi:hypothetical protein
LQRSSPASYWRSAGQVMARQNPPRSKHWPAGQSQPSVKACVHGQPTSLYTQVSTHPLEKRPHRPPASSHTCTFRDATLPWGREPSGRASASKGSRRVGCCGSAWAARLVSGARENSRIEGGGGGGGGGGSVAGSTVAAVAGSTGAGARSSASVQASVRRSGSRRGNGVRTSVEDTRGRVSASIGPTCMSRHARRREEPQAAFRCAGGGRRRALCPSRTPTECMSAEGREAAGCGPQ